MNKQQPLRIGYKHLVATNKMGLSAVVTAKVVTLNKEKKIKKG